MNVLAQSQKGRLSELVPQAEMEKVATPTPTPTRVKTEASDALEVPFVTDEETPSGQYLLLNLLASWGDPEFIGLSAVELFDGNGERIALCEDQLSYIPPESAQLEPPLASRPTALSPQSLFEDPRRRLASLVRPNPSHDTRDELAMWMTDFFGEGKSHIICIDLARPTCLSGIVIHNYLSDRVHSMRGSRLVEITLDDRLLMRGPLRCGAIEPILLTTKAPTLKRLSQVVEKSSRASEVTSSSVSKRSAHTPANATETGAPVPSGGGSGLVAELMLEVLSTWCTPPRGVGLSSIRAYGKSRNAARFAEAAVEVIDSKGSPVQYLIPSPEKEAFLAPLFAPLEPLSHDEDAPLARFRFRFAEPTSLTSIEVCNLTDGTCSYLGEEPQLMPQTFYGVKECRVFFVLPGTNGRREVSPAEGVTFRKAPFSSAPKPQRFDVSDLSEEFLAIEKPRGYLVQSVKMSSELRLKVAIKRNRQSALEIPEWYADYHQYIPQLFPIGYVIAVALSGNGPLSQDALTTLQVRLWDEEGHPIEGYGMHEVDGPANGNERGWELRLYRLFDQPVCISALQVSWPKAPLPQLIPLTIRSIDVSMDDQRVYRREAQEAENLVDTFLSIGATKPTGSGPFLGNGLVYFTYEPSKSVCI